MNKPKIIFSLMVLFFGTSPVFGQDTIRLDKKPEVIIKSWYPEFKEFPALKINDSKILFIIIPDFIGTAIQKNHIELRTSNDKVEIKETVKFNQYLITVNGTNSKDAEFELWLDLTDKTILIQQNDQWINSSDLYAVKGNRLLIDTITLELIE